MLKLYSTFSFRNDLRIISHVDVNSFVGVQGWEGLFCFYHVIQSSRVYEERFGLLGAFHESMSSSLLGIPILIISLLNTVWKIDIISLEEKSHLINIFLHAGMFRVKSLPAIGTLDFLFSLVSFEPEDSSYRWFFSLGFGASNLAFWFFFFPLPFEYFGPKANKAWYFEDLRIPICTSLSCSFGRALMKAFSDLGLLAS